MNTRIKTPWSALAMAAAAAVLATVPRAALAIDGQMLIYHTKALGGNITPGDAAGYPVTISQPGSYKLSGNLVVPDANTTAIEITADNVTLDLNGFAILGPANCASFPCANAGAGYGIRTPAAKSAITLRNGSIQGMGRGGVELRGDSHLVEHLRVRSNGGSGGISLSTDYASGGSSRVQHCAVQRNGGTGIFVTRGAVEHNTADGNESAGIWVNDGRVAYNTVNRNGGYGVGLYTAGAIGNVISNHTVINLYNGSNLGHNLCSGSGGGC